MVYACMQAVILVSHATVPVLRSQATLAAATLTPFAAIVLFTLSRAEHINSVRPSAIINVYLIVTLPFNVAKSRTLWLDGATKPVAAVFTSAVCLKVMIPILEAVEKRSILLDRYRYSSPEATF